MQLTLTNWLLSVRDIVMHNKAVDNKECQRLNSFMVIDSKFQFDKDSFESKSEKAFYFSRDKTKTAFPVLAISIGTDYLADFNNGRYQSFCHPMAVGVIDQYIQNCSECTACEKRTIEEVYIDAALLLKRFINVAANMKWYDVVKGSDHENVFSHIGVIEAKINANVYDSATVIKNESAIYKHQFSLKNPSPTFNDLPITKLNTLAKWTDITICDGCTANDEMIFKYKKLTNE